MKQCKCQSCTNAYTEIQILAANNFDLDDNNFLEKKGILKAILISKRPKNYNDLHNIFFFRCLSGTQMLAINIHVHSSLEEFDSYAPKPLSQVFVPRYTFYARSSFPHTFPCRINCNNPYLSLFLMIYPKYCNFRALIVLTISSFSFPKRSKTFHEILSILRYIHISKAASFRKLLESIFADKVHAFIPRFSPLRIER